MREKRAVRRCISIHALHEESDPDYEFRTTNKIAISIHALHEESDNIMLALIRHYEQFQSTLSMRRATYPILRQIAWLDDFNPRSP